MKYRELYLKMLNAKEQHDRIKFVHFYTQICTARNLTADDDAIKILDDDVSEDEKQIVMTKILIEVQHLLNK